MYSKPNAQFILVMQAIVQSGKQLQQLGVKESMDDNCLEETVQSNLLRKLVLLASSPDIIKNAEKMLSALNKAAIDKKDLSCLFIASSGQFPEVRGN